jgi:sugar phosphate permease
MRWVIAALSKEVSVWAFAAFQVLFVIFLGYCVIFVKRANYLSFLHHKNIIKEE